jgi:hypothetical protein
MVARPSASIKYLDWLIGTDGHSEEVGSRASRDWMERGRLEEGHVSIAKNREIRCNNRSLI